MGREAREISIIPARGGPKPTEVLTDVLLKNSWILGNDLGSVPLNVLLVVNSQIVSNSEIIRALGLEVDFVGNGKGRFW